MRRRLTTIGVILLLGAIVNVAVAWAGQIPDLIKASPWSVMSDQDRDRDWREFAFPSWPTPPEPFGIQYQNPIWMAQQIDDSMDVGTNFGFYRVCSGWPCKALQAITAREGNKSLDQPGWFLISMRRSRLDVVLPHDVLWPGFAINTIFYAGVLWLLFAAPFKIRRHFRIKRGLCTACGYNLTGLSATSTICPECGQPVTPQHS